ncbi:glycoside hydrolase [Endothiovibrio diazotrophicus]
MVVSGAKRLRVVLYWHMHQPFYKDAEDGTYHLPWTYLHAIKDYVDMAAHLEAAPDGACAVVNFAPTLLEQIDDYADQVAAHLERGEPIADPLLAALHGGSFTEDPAARLELVRNCLRANEERLINRFPHYRRLVELANWAAERDGMARYLNDQYLADLVVWYHLAWLGESVRRVDSRVKRLMDKGVDYSLEERRLLVQVIGELLSGVIERYRLLALAGKAELSVTPYAHPIAPLLLDIDSARQAMPHAELPRVQYPGGEERTQWHIREGIAVFRRHFGFDPKGCWPAEGSVSDASLRALEKGGFHWAASGEGVLRNSLAAAGGAPSRGVCGDGLFHPYVLEGGELACFFRDDGLSDLIGFTYASWHADDAVSDFIGHLENIAAACHEERDSVVSVILDGENAWEYYPENGYYFLSALYRRLAEHPSIELTTFSACLDAPDCGCRRTIPHLVAGSWVYGTFSTWIGERDKNLGWEMLIEAKRAFDEAVAAGLSGEALAAAEHQLAICEGSDWFWWFGDYNPADAVKDFEGLYRSHLRTLYRMIEVEPPAALFESFTHGGTDFVAAGGVMRQGKPS